MGERPVARTLLEEILPRGSKFSEFEVNHEFPHLGRRTMLLNARRLQKEVSQAGLILLAFDDVTERRQADQQRARLAEMEAAATAKDQFMASLSHELRTPLTPVLMAAAALDAREDLPAEVHTELAGMRHNIQLQARLIDDLLDLTRIVRGKLELTLAPQRLCELLKEVVAICQSDIQAKELHLQLELRPAEKCKVSCVLGMVPACSRSSGTCSATPSSSRRKAGTSPCDASNPDHRVVVQVSDSGVGIAPEVLPTLFRAFEQGGRATTRQFGGLGLGLAISKLIVEQHHGTLRGRVPARARVPPSPWSCPSAPRPRNAKAPLS